jgi:cytochrome c2
VVCHHGHEQARRADIAHLGIIPGRLAWWGVPGAAVVKRGERLIDTFACRRCHTIAGRGNQLAMDLDTVATTTHPQELERAIAEPAPAMPDFRFTGIERAEVVNALVFLAQGRGGKETSPQVVHFSLNSAEQSVFARQCGGCHRLLSQRYGLLGQGVTGPNLSGLLTPFYPRTYGNGERWNRERLKRWLHNPRQVRATARMMPQQLKKDDFERLMQELGSREIPP